MSLWCWCLINEVLKVEVNGGVVLRVKMWFFVGKLIGLESQKDDRILEKASI